MTDSCGRTIDYLRLSVTDCCNLGCAYCMPAGGWTPSGTLCSTEELVELAAACVALGVKKLRLTGGEPLLRPDILALTARLRALPGLEELVMTTNGQRLATLAAPLREAGLDRLNVSLDTLRPERYRALTGGGTLDRVLEGLDAAESAGFAPPKLNAVLLRGVNDDELADLARLAQTTPCSVRFIELMPIGPGAAMPEAFLPAGRVLEAMPELRELQKTTADRPDGVARLYTAPGWAGTVGLITPMSCDFCAACRRIRITADGSLTLCLHASEEIPLRGLQGEALQETIRAALGRKPARHCLRTDAPSQSRRPMHRIGGRAGPPAFHPVCKSGGITVYLRSKLIRFLKLKNLLFVIVGVFFAAFCVETMTELTVQYFGDWETILTARRTPESAVLFLAGMGMILYSRISRRLIQDANYFSRYFEGDLSGYIEFEELAEVTGKTASQIRRRLKLLRRIYMKKFQFVKTAGGSERIELYSKKVSCTCRSCGGELEKRVYFTGECPWCGSSDLSAKTVFRRAFFLHYPK